MTHGRTVVRGGPVITTADELPADELRADELHADVLVEGERAVAPAASGDASRDQQCFVFMTG